MSRENSFVKETTDKTSVVIEYPTKNKKVSTTKMLTFFMS